MDTVSAFAAFLEGILKHVYFMSLVWAMLGSQAITQLAKFPLRRWFYSQGIDPYSKLTPEIEVAYHRWCVRAIAVVSGALFAFLTWPGDSLTLRCVVALCVGGSSPLVYQIVTHFWPWLGEKASADRGLPPTLQPPSQDADRQ